MSIQLLLGTGMQSQELLALEPRHIEPGGSVIHIRQAINMVKGTAYVGVPKSRDSYRDIPVPKSLQYCTTALRLGFESPQYFSKRFRKQYGMTPMQLRSGIMKLQSSPNLNEKGCP